MLVGKLSDMTRGWFVGNFEPSALRTDRFEVGLLKHKKGEVWPAHYHAVAVECNLLLKGSIKFGDVIVSAGEIFTFMPFEVAVPEFLEDCEVIVVKVPSIIGDKYIV